MVARIAPLLVVLGETASGKSELALKLAKRLSGEIICADSWTVYKGFDIGTAKPSAREQGLVRHYLLDVTTANKGFSAPQFQRMALAAISDISARGKLPIMVGGSGLYIDSVIFNYSFLPAGTKKSRQELNNLSLSELLSKAGAMNLELSTIDTRNKRRVVRLIENRGELPTKTSLRPNTYLLGLETTRKELAIRVGRRVDRMLEQGLEQEVAGLAERYGWDSEPMKGVGYREWQAYFAGEQTLEETKDKIVRSSLALAKKQRIWFGRSIYNKSIQWIPNSSKLDDIVEFITTKLNK